MPFVVALALSALLHAAAVGMPGWSLPGAAEVEPPPMAAHLMPAPAPPVEKPRQRPRAKKPAPSPAIGPVAALPAPAVQEPAVQEPATVAEAAAPPQEPAAVVAAEEPPAAVPPSPVAEPAMPPWPRQGRVRYVVTYGAAGFVIGETIQQWRVDATGYTISSLAEPKGLAALRGRTRTQTSAGEVTSAGLRPHEFRDQREGREPETATFDWSGARVAFSGGRGDALLPEGTQDMISVFYQLAWLLPRQDVDLAVATASRVGRWSFEWLGEERLELAAGSLSAVHLRTRADGDSTEVWLAPAHGGLPVKIRHVDRKGDVFEQAADLLEFN